MGHMNEKEDPFWTNWITAVEAAGLLGVTRSYVGKLVRAGVFEGRKIHPRLLLVRRSSLEGWTRKRRPKRHK